MARTPEPKTQAVRQLLNEHGPDLTWSPSEDGQPSAKLLLKALGFTDNAKSEKKRITENDFNVKKHLYLKSQGKTVVTERNGSVRKTVALPKSDVTTVIAAVNKSGGLDTYRTTLANEVEKLDRLRERLAAAEAKVAEMEANVATYEQVQKAVA